MLGGCPPPDDGSTVNIVLQLLHPHPLSTSPYHPTLLPQKGKKKCKRDHPPKKLPCFKWHILGRYGQGYGIGPIPKTDLVGSKTLSTDQQKWEAQSLSSPSGLLHRGPGCWLKTQMPGIDMYTMYNCTWLYSQVFQIMATRWRYHFISRESTTRW